MKNFSLRFVYLYLFSAIGLLIAVIGLISGVNLAIKTVFFKDVDSYMSYPMYPVEGAKLTQEEIEKQKQDFDIERKKEISRNQQRELSNTISMVLVGIPLYLYHWNLIKKENG